jgi:hypothetical protein
MRAGVFVSVSLFAIACCLPALEYKDGRAPLIGINALAVGWSGIFAGVVGWYANPVWLLGLVFGFLRKPVIATAAGVIAVLIAATVFTLLGRELPGDEGGVTKISFSRLLVGCYVWLASLATLPVWALVYGTVTGRWK